MGKPQFISVDAIAPADYNPRRIDDSDFDALCDSLRTMGVVVPVIVNRKNNVIIAGHQRQKAAKAIGMAEVPFYYADNVSASDEVLFNQIHNGTDFDLGCIAHVEPQSEIGWVSIAPEDNHADCDKATIVMEICKLLQRYGNVLSCVMTQKGEVFKSAAYVMACKLLNIPANAYVIEPETEAFAREAFNANYGVFSYEHLEKHTWVQGTAQLYRRKTKGKKGKTLKSRLYERLVLPEIEPWMRILDFGAGKEGYAAELRSRGYDVDCIEFYHNNLKGIDVGRTLKEAEHLFARLKERGLYDVVVCDSVLNSVDSLEAERAVVATCNAMLAEGGVLFISGRPVEVVGKTLRAKRASQAASRMCFEFLDADNFTARFRNGNFYYQHYHSKDQVKALMQEHGFLLQKDASDSMGWRVKCTKKAESPYADEGVRFEFSLPYPGGRYELADEAISAIDAARIVTANGRTASSDTCGTHASGR